MVRGVSTCRFILIDICMHMYLLWSGIIVARQ